MPIIADSGIVSWAIAVRIEKIDGTTATMTAAMTGRMVRTSGSPRGRSAGLTGSTASFDVLTAPG
jgi:hypothetical protein